MRRRTLRAAVPSWTLVAVPRHTIPPDVSLGWLRSWATLLDAQFRVPGTQIRFGLDPLLSLVPGLGDLASPLFATLLIVQALRQRVPKVIILRMLGNALVDAFIGVVPIAGNIADIFWRANTKNLALLERHARPGRRPTTSDFVFAFAIAALFGMLVLIPVALAIWLAAMFWTWAL
jgi:hypothetical protein